MNNNTDLKFEPTLTATFLPRCESCHGAHPLATGSESKTCLNCGTAIKEPYEIELENLTWSK